MQKDTCKHRLSAYRLSRVVDKAITLLQIEPNGATQVEKRSATAKKIDIAEKVNTF